MPSSISPPRQRPFVLRMAFALLLLPSLPSYAILFPRLSSLLLRLILTTSPPLSPPPPHSILVSDPTEIDRIIASPDFDNSNTFAEVFAGLIPLAMLGRLTDNLVKVHRRAFAYVRVPRFFSARPTVAWLDARWS